MKLNLLYRPESQEYGDINNELTENRLSDLEAEGLINSMSSGDSLIYKICRKYLNAPLHCDRDIIYRQDILKDCIEKPEILRKLFAICKDADERRRNSWYRLNSPHLSTVYSSAVDLIRIYMEALVEIRRAIEKESFSSVGLRNFSEMLCSEISDSYLEELKNLKGSINDSGEILISAGFGPFLQGVSYVKRKKNSGLSRLQWLLLPSYTIADEDMNGLNDLGMRRDRAINNMANAMAQAAENLESFINSLREELAFYIGAVNLYESLLELRLPVCFPVISCDGGRCWQNMYDPGLALHKKRGIIGNSLSSRGQPLWLITGANQGGKTTFLRSVGLCQLMAQCGLFVCAESCIIPLKNQLYTHFKREEDAKMKSGRLDEELGRMSRIIDELKPGDILLSNESFSSTNDPEGSEIFAQITQALLDSGVEVFSVSHLINYALAFADSEDCICLRAERNENGERSFRILPGKPLSTAFGVDIYIRVFSDTQDNEIN